MADIPLRLAILQRLTALLEQTDGLDHAGNPYNLVGSVYRGRTEFGDETEIPALSILEAPNPDIGVFAGENEAFRDTWVLLLQGWAVDDKMNPSDPAYYLAAAVQKQLSRIMTMRSDGSGRPVDKVNYMLGDTIAGIQVGPYVVRPLEKAASARAFFYLPVRISVAQSIDQPYLTA